MNSELEKILEVLVREKIGTCPALNRTLYSEKLECMDTFGIDRKETFQFISSLLMIQSYRFNEKFIFIAINFVF